MDLEGKLKESGFFTSLPAGSLRQLAEICFLRRAKKREVLFLEGDEGGLFFQLLSGRIQLYRLSEDGREIAIKVVRPGEIFAEVILFEQDRYPVCGSAITDCELIAVPSRQFACLLENRDFRNNFILMLMKKQRYLTDRIMYLTSGDAESRFKSFLIEQYGESGNYRIGISKRDIATAIGVTPETLSRLIHRLTESGIMDWSRERLSIDSSYLKGTNSFGI
ncbi:MAG: Crp/Fnr family transcriptional regulator [Spirochaetales bacterium]|nr:Crp/Fnr family transcriptional regulator [Spirochaetales bacterium]